jgi:Kae1-associated kinase Bud32
MSHINGQKVRDILSENPVELCKENPTKKAKMHANGIIHADLTTSNMILADEVNFIDFGLSFFSDKIEDKAVDLHLMDRALESKHYDMYPACWEAVLKGYSSENPEAKEVLTRLEKVQSRGRNKQKN